MKLLFIAHYPSLFGANRSLLTLIEGLQKKNGVGIQVILPKEGEFSAELKKRGVRYWATPFEYNTHDAASPDRASGTKADALRPMLDVAGQVRPDIIYSNSSLVYYGAWLAKITGTPHVWHLREYGDLDYKLERDFGIGYFQARLRECATAIAISQSIDRHLLGFDVGRKQVVYNGVARLDQCAVRPRELADGPGLRLAILGLIHPTKGQHHAVDAVRVLRDSFPNITLKIGGSGDPRYVDPLAAQIRRDGLQKSVELVGYVADPLAWLRREADILLMCSENEAFGRVTAEAMTQGIPVIGTATGGTTEIITDGLNGLLYSGGPQQLADKIVWMAEHREKYAELSRHALDTAKSRFTMERYVGEIYEILERVMRADRIPGLPKFVPTRAAAAKEILAPDAFLNPPLEPNYCDLYGVRSSILRAIKQASLLFEGVLLDIGCGVMPYRKLLTKTPSRITRYIGLDINTEIYKAQVDLRWDGKHIPLDDASVDCAMATEVLEHCPDPLVVLREARRVLKPGGTFFFTVPYIWPLHDAPYDFFRYTPFALELLLAKSGFDHVNVQALGGWNASFAQMMGLWLKRAPMPDDVRRRAVAQLWPLYQELIRSDEFPEDPKAANTMATGWSGVAFVPAPAKAPGLDICDLPMALVRCDEYKYSETFLDDHVRYLSQKLTVVHGIPFPRFLTGGSSAFPDELESKLRTAVAEGGWPFPPQLWQEYADAFANFLRSAGVRVALLETGIMASFVHEACQRAGVPFVVHFHGIDATGREILDRWGGKYREVFDGAASLVVVSEAMRAQLLKLGAPPDRVVLAPYGVLVDLPRLADPSRAPSRFLAVGRFVEKKGPLHTLQAFALVRQCNPEAQLVMVGDGPLLASCRRWVQTRGLGDAVTFTGVLSREAVSRLMADSRVFVQHSLVAANGDSEGLPLAILEAGAHCLPVVSTCHAGIPDAVTDGVHGFLVPEGDVVSMTERMLLLANDAELAAKMGAAFRERVCADFSRTRSIRRLQEILQRAAERPGSKCGCFVGGAHRVEMQTETASGSSGS